MNSARQPFIQQQAGQHNHQFEALPLQPLYTDLLLQSANYICKKCRVPLAAFTRIVVRKLLTNIETGFENMCIACFAGWMKTPRLLKGQKYQTLHEYEYFVMPSAMQTKSGDWTVFEIISLFQLVSIYGSDSWQLLQRTFNQKTGKCRQILDLKNKYIEFRRNSSFQSFCSPLYPPYNIEFDISKQQCPLPLTIYRHLQMQRNGQYESQIVQQFYAFLKNNNIITRRLGKLKNKGCQEFLLMNLLRTIQDKYDQVQLAIPQIQIMEYEKNTMILKYKQLRDRQLKQKFQFIREIFDIYAEGHLRRHKKQRDQLPPQEAQEEEDKGQRLSTILPEMTYILADMRDVKQETDPIDDLQRKQDINGDSDANSVNSNHEIEISDDIQEDFEIGKQGHSEDDEEDRSEYGSQEKDPEKESSESIQMEDVMAQQMSSDIQDLISQ